MILNEVLGIQEIRDKSTRITTRRAARAVILKGGKILMVHTNKGDYKFPGGGVKRQEELMDALRREVEEETGYIVKHIGRKIGLITQRNINQFDTNGIFEMTSYYYYCDVEDTPTSQHLDKYEEEQEFTPMWLTIDEAISQNELILNSKSKQSNPWVYRETLALKYLKKHHIK